MNMWVLLARQGPPMEVELQTSNPPNPSATSFPFLLGYGVDKDSAECRAGGTIGIEPHHLHPASCEKVGICGLVLR